MYTTYMHLFSTGEWDVLCLLRYYIFDYLRCLEAFEVTDQIRC